MTAVERQLTHPTARLMPNALTYAPFSFVLPPVFQPNPEEEASLKRERQAAVRATFEALYSTAPTLSAAANYSAPPAPPPAPLNAAAISSAAAAPATASAAAPNASASTAAQMQFLPLLPPMPPPPLNAAAISSAAAAPATLPRGQACERCHIQQKKVSCV
jgi:hypothetical protein